MQSHGVLVRTCRQCARNALLHRAPRIVTAELSTSLRASRTARQTPGHNDKVNNNRDGRHSPAFTRPRSDGRRGPPSNAAPSELQLSAVDKVDDSHASAADLLKQLKRRTHGLARHEAGSSIVQIIDVLATKLGLGKEELSMLAQTWARSDPFHDWPSAQGAPSHGRLKGKRKHVVSAVDESRQMSALRSDLRLHGVHAFDRTLLSQFFAWLRDPTVQQDHDLSPALLSLLGRLDMRYPQEWYPETRGIRRKLILHVGPTNSGKTYNALCALAQARVGAFAGPLRLLANEVYHRFNAGTIGGLTPDKPRLCNLITGEESRIHDPHGGLESFTVEMLNLSKQYDVVVIDEIQMIADPYRGMAWTHALLGVKADEVHLCGEPSVVDLIKRIGRACGDEVIVKHYDRLSPLVVAKKSLENDLTKVTRGDCVVTFSRSNIFAIKADIEKATGLRVAVAYGGLPPEVREEQAKGFNAPETPRGYDVMVASDAIGMGLNLRIKRVIFQTLNKFDGRQEIDLSYSQIKQIGGRAGRYKVDSDKSPSAPDVPDEPATGQGTASKQADSASGQKSPGDDQDTTSGVVTCLNERDMPLLRTAMKATTVSIDRAALHPLEMYLDDLAALLPKTTPQAQVFELFPLVASASPDYFIPPLGLHLRLSQDLDKVASLGLADKIKLGYTPVSVRDPEQMNAFMDWATAFAQTRAVQLTKWLETQGYSDLLDHFREVESIFDDLDSRSRSSREGGAPGLSFSSMTNVERMRDFATPRNLSRLETLHKCLSVYLWLGNRYSLIFSQVAEARLFRDEVQKAIHCILQHLKFQARRPEEAIGRRRRPLRSRAGAIGQTSDLLERLVGSGGAREQAGTARQPSLVAT